MAKSKFFRVAVSGPTIDGRNIEPAWLEQMAANYNPQTYAARGNLEHVRGVTGQPPFSALADIIALKAGPTEIVVNGKPEQRTGLFAQIEPTADLIELNKKKQKLYTSIEVSTDFAGTKQAGLLGLAFTDSPASLGTDRLEFTARAKAYGSLISEPVEIDLQMEEAPPATAIQTEALGAFTAMKTFFSGFGQTRPPEPVTPPVVTPPAQPDAAAFATQILTGMQAMANAIEAGQKLHAEGVAKLTADFEALKGQVEKTPTSAYTARPVNAGGGSLADLSDF